MKCRQPHIFISFRSRDMIFERGFQENRVFSLLNSHSSTLHHLILTLDHIFGISVKFSIRMMYCHSWKVPSKDHNSSSNIDGFEKVKFLKIFKTLLLFHKKFWKLANLLKTSSFNKLSNGIVSFYSLEGTFLRKSSFYAKKTCVFQGNRVF